MKFCPKCGTRLKSSAKRCAVCPRSAKDTGAPVDESRETAPVKAALAQSFPYGSMRPFQKDVLERIESALASGKKFIILEAPVGFGKSAIAAALCRHLGSAYVLTSTKQLQAQYSADFGFSTAMGKSNFTCYVPTSSGRQVACSKGRCEADWKLSDCPHYLTFEQYEDHVKGLCDRDSKCEKLRGHGNGKVCSYYKQKWDSFREPVTAGNYAFYLSELRFTEDVRHRKLLVCDEAHDLERQLVGSASFTLRTASIRQYHAGGGKEFDVAYEEGMEEDAAAWLGALGAAKEQLRGFFDAHAGDLTMQDRLASCRGTLESLEGFTDELKAAPENWIVSSVRRSAEGSSVEEVVFQPLGVGHYTSSVFAATDTVLLMSATVFSKELLCKTLGIPEEEACFIRVPESSFPVENRLIHAMDVAFLSWASMESSLEGIAKAVDAIMSLHAGERGIVHTTSYPQVRYITEHVSSANRARLMTTEGVSERSALLRTHASTEAAVLISPSLYEGLDLKDELARFQVIVKVPYPSLSDRRTVVKLEMDKGWYDWQTAQRLVQTYGRSVRSETDYAETYVLDSNFTRFVNDHRDLFPRYFLEALR